jgi:thioredoxin reductase
VPIHLDQRVMDVVQRDDGRWTVRTEQGMVFDAAAVMLAAGNGAFLPQRLMLPEAAALEERDVLYSVPRLADFAGKDVVVAGGGDSALDWALALRKVARRLTLVHRRSGFSATASSVESMKRAVAAGEMDFVVGMIGGLKAPGGTLQSIEIKQVEGVSERAADKLVVLYGLVADLGPIAELRVFASGHLRGWRHRELSEQAEAHSLGLSRGVARAAKGLFIRVSGEEARARAFELRHETRRARSGQCDGGQLSARA